MIAATDTALAPARQHLSDTIANLIDPKPVTLDSGRRTWLDSTYQQLAAAVYEKRSLGGGRIRSASPLWIDASDSLCAIERTVWAEHPERPTISRQNGYQQPLTAITVWRLQQIDARTWRPQDTDHINQFTDQLDTHTRRAENLLDPPKTINLPHACPNCGNTWIHTRHNGEPTRQHTLQLHVNDCTCQCRNPDCDGQWTGIQRLIWLGKLLNTGDITTEITPMELPTATLQIPVVSRCPKHPETR